MLRFAHSTQAKSFSTKRRNVGWTKGLPVSITKADYGHAALCHSTQAKSFSTKRRMDKGSSRVHH
jgi:hypothetical protein